MLWDEDNDKVIRCHKCKKVKCVVPITYNLKWICPNCKGPKCYRGKRY